MLYDLLCDLLDLTLLKWPLRRRKDSHSQSECSLWDGQLLRALRTCDAVGRGETGSGHARVRGRVHISSSPHSQLCGEARVKYRNRHGLGGADSAGRGGPSKEPRMLRTTQAQTALGGETAEQQKQQMQRP